MSCFRSRKAGASLRHGEPWSLLTFRDVGEDVPEEGHPVRGHRRWSSDQPVESSSRYKPTGDRSAVEYRRSGRIDPRTVNPGRLGFQWDLATRISASIPASVPARA